MGEQSTTEYLDVFAVVVKFVFSWLVVLPAGTIISGKLLARPIRFTTETKQLIRIPLKFFVLEATDGEVILGFASLFITFFFAAVFFGKPVYALVKENFGVDPGQFHAIFLFSALLTVIWSSIIFLSYLISTRSKHSGLIDDAATYRQRIEGLVKRGDI